MTRSKGQTKEVTTALTPKEKEDLRKREATKKVELPAVVLEAIPALWDHDEYFIYAHAGEDVPIDKWYVKKNIKKKNLIKAFKTRNKLFEDSHNISVTYRKPFKDIVETNKEYKKRKKEEKKK